MLLEYIQTAMETATYEILPEENLYYGEVPACKGVYSSSATLEGCRNELREVLEEWIFFRLSKNLSLPVIQGKRLKFKRAA